MVGANQQSQAVPCVRLENPKVATGLEKYIARDCDYVQKAKEAGEIIYSDGLKVILEGESGEKFEYSTIKFMPSNGHTAINQKVVVKAGEKVKKENNSLACLLVLNDRNKLICCFNILITKVFNNLEWFCR